MIFRRFLLLCGLASKGLFSESQILLAPLCLVWCLVILLSLVFSGLADPWKGTVVIGQCLVAVLVALSWFLMKVFYGLRRGGVYDHLRLVPVGPLTLFLAYSFLGLLFGLVALVGILGGSVLLAGGVEVVGGWSFVRSLILATLGFIMGLVPLGVLCSLLTVRSTRESFVFPLIFYPLSVPLALAVLVSLKAGVESEGSLLWWMVFFYFVLSLALSKEAPQ